MNNEGRRKFRLGQRLWLYCNDRSWISRYPRTVKVEQPDVSSNVERDVDWPIGDNKVHMNV